MSKQKKVKTFYKGVFNFRCKMEVMYGWAYTKSQVWAVFCRRIAHKHVVSVGAVMEVFEPGKENYSIKEEPT